MRDQIDDASSSRIPKPSEEVSHAFNHNFAMDVLECFQLGPGTI